MSNQIFQSYKHLWSVSFRLHHEEEGKLSFLHLIENINVVFGESQMMRRAMSLFVTRCVCDAVARLSIKINILLGGGIFLRSLHDFCVYISI